jgi:phosphopantetheine attachment domain protein
VSSNEISEKVLDIIKTNIGIEIYPWQFDEDLNVIGIDSISFIQIVVALEDNFEIEIPDEKLLMEEMGTFNKITMVVASALNSRVIK